MAVIPNSNLPPQSQPWGRSVDARIADLQRLAERNSLDSDNNLKQLASSVQLLSSQVTDVTESLALLGEIGKSTSSTSGGFSRTTNGTTNDLVNVPTITLSLAVPSRVLVTGSVRVTGHSGASSINPELQAIVSWATNYSPATAIATCLYYNRIIPPAGQVVQGSASVSSSEVISVAAGTLTISPLQGTIVLNGGGGGSAIIQASPITISAIVLPE